MPSRRIRSLRESFAMVNRPADGRTRTGTGLLRPNGF
jgi:hypothetical protein